MNLIDNYTEPGKNIRNSSKRWEGDGYFDIGQIPFVLQKINIQNHHAELKHMMRFNRYSEVLDELTTIKRQLNRPITPIQRYAKTKHAAAYLDVDASYLTKRMGNVFIEGKHYFYPEKESIVRWDLEQLQSWLRNEESKGEAHDFLSNIEL